MVSGRAAVYSRDIELLLNEFGDGDPPDSSEVSDDINGLVAAVLAFARSIVDVPRLDAEAALDSDIDIGRIEAALDKLRTVAQPPPYKFPGNDNEIEWAKELEELEQAIASFHEAQQEHGPLEAQLRVNLHFDFTFARMLVCSVDDETVAWLEAEVRSALASASDEVIARAWEGVLSDFS